MNCNGTDLESIGKRIKNARENLKMKQEELAEKLVCKREVISYYEHGNRDIKTDTLINLARILGVSTDYLLGLSPNPTQNKDLDAICRYVGLGQEAVERLHTFNPKFISTLNSLLENNNFWALVERIGKYREYSKDAVPIELYLNYGEYADMRENSSVHSIKNRDFCLFQIQELIKIVAKDGVENG